MSDSQDKRSTYEIKNEIEAWEDMNMYVHRDANDAHFEFEDSISDIKRIQEYMLDSGLHLGEGVQAGKRMVARLQLMIEDYTKKFNSKVDTVLEDLNKEYRKSFFD